MSNGKKEVRLTQRDINSLWGAISSIEMITSTEDALEKYPTHPKFKYGLAYNQDGLKKPVRVYQKYVKDDHEYDVYDTQRLEIVKIHAVRNADGEFAQHNGQVIMLDQGAYERELKALQERHSAYAARQAILDEEHDVQFHLIPFEYIPEWLPPGLLREMLPFIVYTPDMMECPECKAVLQVEDGVLTKVGGADPQD